MVEVLMVYICNWCGFFYTASLQVYISGGSDVTVVDVNR